MDCQRLLSTSDEIECAESLLMLASVAHEQPGFYGHENSSELGHGFDVKLQLPYTHSVTRTSDKSNSNCEYEGEFVDIENYRQCVEMIRRIRLDHCYASTHLFGQRSVWREAQLPAITSNSLEDLHKYSLSPTAGISDEDFHARKESFASDKHNVVEDNGQSGDDDSTDGEYVDSESAPKWKQGQVSKRRNFNALLECFQDDFDASETKRQNRQFSKKVSKSAGTSPGNRRTWPQSFSKKRYMMKHNQDTPVNAGGTVIYGSTGSLNVQYQFKSFAKVEAGNTDHYAYAEDGGQARLDLCECQLCHIRLKRNLLVKHLASEHCVEPGMVHKPNKQQSGVSSRGEKKDAVSDHQEAEDSRYLALEDVVDVSVAINMPVPCADEQIISQFTALEENVVQPVTEQASRQNYECVENGGNEALMSTNYLESVVYVADSQCDDNSFSSEALDHSYEVLEQSSMYMDDSLSLDDEELYEEESDASDLMMPSCSVLGAPNLSEIIHV